MVTEEKARQINALVQEKLGVKWDLLEPESLRYAVLNAGVSVEHLPPFPPRLLQDGWKVGTSSWLCVCCEVVKQAPITIEGLEEAVNLVLFEVPDDTMALLYHRIAGGLPQYFAQPVGKDSIFPCYNWNPVPLRAIEDFDQYMSGWVM